MLAFALCTDEEFHSHLSLRRGYHAMMNEWYGVWILTQFILSFISRNFFRAKQQMHGRLQVVIFTLFACLVAANSEASGDENATSSNMATPTSHTPRYIHHL